MANEFRKSIAMLLFKDLITELKQKNYEAGYNEGIEDGEKIGYNNGFKAGNESGYRQGFDEGSKGGVFINSSGICVSDGNGKFTHSLPIAERST